MDNCQCGLFGVFTPNTSKNRNEATILLFSDGIILLHLSSKSCCNKFMKEAVQCLLQKNGGKNLKIF